MPIPASSSRVPGRASRSFTRGGSGWRRPPPIRMEECISSCPGTRKRRPLVEVANGSELGLGRVLTDQIQDMSCSKRILRPDNQERIQKAVPGLRIRLTVPGTVKKNRRLGKAIWVEVSVASLRVFCDQRHCSRGYRTSSHELRKRVLGTGVQRAASRQNRWRQKRVSCRHIILCQYERRNHRLRNP